MKNLIAALMIAGVCSGCSTVHVSFFNFGGRNPFLVQNLKDEARAESSLDIQAASDLSASVPASAVGQAAGASMGLPSYVDAYDKYKVEMMSLLKNIQSSVAADVEGTIPE